jgi:hypothetical protein
MSQNISNNYTKSKKENKMGVHPWLVGRKHQHRISPNSTIHAFSSLGVGSFVKQVQSHDGTIEMAEFSASSCRAVYRLNLLRKGTST